MATPDPGQIATELPAAVRRRRTKGQAAPVLPDATREIGASGTENLMGIISGVEYLPALIPPDGLKVYEQMRNLAQVQASLAVVKTPVLSSTPIVRAPKQGDPVDQGIADFCQQALFGNGSMRLPWRRVFEHLMTRLDFGVAVCEKVWRYDLESGTWRLNKLAPRLATTLWEWRLDPATGELGSVVQQTFRADGAWTMQAIPASKLLVSTYQREGDNFWGRSLLRSAYFHWYAIMELLRIGLVRADRHGVGIPVGHFNTIDAFNNTRLMTQMKRALKGLRSHERAYLVEHPDVEYKMLGLNGTDGGVKLKDDIDFHASMIVQNVLGSFLSGQSDGMSTNRTRTLADVFTSVLELCAGDIADDLESHVIRELCDLNFVMAGREYPTVAFTNIADTDLDGLVNNYTRLVAVGTLQTIPEDEAHFREQMKLPAAPPRDATPDASGSEDPVPDPAGDAPPPDASADDPTTALRLSRRPGPAVLLSRAPTAVETFLLREPEAIARAMNHATDTLVTRLAAIRNMQLESLAQAIAKKDARTTTAAFSDLRPSEFEIPQRALTVRAIRDTHKAAFADGRRQVRQELSRQGAAVSLRLTADVDEWMGVIALAGGAKTPKPKPQAQPALPDTPKAARSALTTSAQITAEKLNDIWFNRVMETAVRLRRGGTTGEELVAQTYQALEGELTVGLYGIAKAEVNEAVALGRGVEARVHEDEIETCVYSCLLDVNSCDKCEALDGEEFAYDSPRYYELQVPYKFCDGNKGGGDACRCEILFLLKGRTV